MGRSNALTLTAGCRPHCGASVSLYLISKFHDGHAYEVLSYDKATHTAVVRDNERTMVDTNFHVEIVKRVFDLTDVKPEGLT